jgi:F-type H+-transporting ATPase subunit b
VKNNATWVLAFVVFVVLAFLIDEPGSPEFLPGEAKRLLLAANLTLFLYILWRLIGKPINSSLEARGEGIANELAEAKDKLAEAEKLRAEVAARLDKVEAEVAEITERAAVQGRAEADRIDAQAREEEERFIKRVDDQIARRQEETRQQLAKDTAELTAKLTKELLAKTMTDDDQKRVLARSLDALESIPGKE